jgi:hypothetical protein
LGSGGVGLGGLLGEGGGQVEEAKRKMFFHGIAWCGCSGNSRLVYLPPRMLGFDDSFVLL